MIVLLEYIGRAKGIYLPTLPSARVKFENLLRFGENTRLIKLQV